MVTSPVLGFPDFSKEFIVETDASNTGIEVVLSQDKHPISFYSCKLSGRMKSASVYVREMFAIIQPVGNGGTTS